MRADADGQAIKAEVAGMRVGRLAGLTTRAILTGLRRRAYAPAQLEQLARDSEFGAATVTVEGIELEATLLKA
jgi:hypothetical protein